jgi:CheY-like chemotaxis protein
VDLFKSQPYANEIVWLNEFETKLFSASFDEAKIQQALMKVIENSVQAITGPGKILVRSRNLELTESWRDGNVTLAPGCYVCAEVVDSGCGITHENMPRIFEPFFTTKQGHRGLGLAWVYGIVTNHSGNVVFASQPDKGTCVRIYLSAHKKIYKDHSINTDNLSGQETILMVDDEDLLLTMGDTILSAYGYTVLTANNGQKALEILKQSPSKVDLVITDLVMPMMSGREFIDKVRVLNPNMRILCISGHVRSNNAEETENYLKKPFTSQDLLKKVKMAIAGRE